MFIGDQASFLTVKQATSVITDCYVDSRGLIFKDGSVIFNFALEHLVWLDTELNVKHIAADERFHNFYKTNLIAERLNAFNEGFINKIGHLKISSYDKTTLYLKHPFWDYEYGHFFDTFQKMCNVDLNSFDSILISNPKKIIDFDVHLRCFKLHEKSIVERINQDSLLFFRELIYPHPVSGPCDFSKKSYEYIRKMYFENFKINNVTEKKNKLFLSRGAGSARQIINFAPLSMMLANEGVIIVDGTEPLEEVTDLFANATHVAGYHGAAFVNTVFCDENVKFLEYCPQKREVACFKNQFRKSGKYTMKLIDTDDDFNAVLPVEELINFYSS